VRILIIVLAALAAFLAPTSPANAGPSPLPDVPWVGANPYGFAIGDSVLEQCRADFGMGWRSLGYVGWPGATTTEMRTRLTDGREGYPYTTEASNAEERQWFRDAGWLVVALGTNDGWRGVPMVETRANIEWIMTEARGRPVLWFDVRQSPQLSAGADAVNEELQAAAGRWPNLKILPWHAWTAANADELIDGVHVKTYERGCEQGRNRLIRHGAPAESTAADNPIGYWYPHPATSGPVPLTGWLAGYTPRQREYVSLNVRSDYGHVGRWSATGATSDLWAWAAGGRSFSVTLGAEFRGHLICLDAIDATGQWTSLGCRTP